MQKKIIEKRSFFARGYLCNPLSCSCLTLHMVEVIFVLCKSAVSRLFFNRESQCYGNYSYDEKMYLSGKIFLLQIFLFNIEI